MVSIKKIDKFIEKNNFKGSEKYIAKSLLLSGCSVKDVKAKVKGYSNINTGSIDTNTHATLTCPRCKSTMKVVSIANSRKVKYCIYDRISLPLPVLNSKCKSGE